LQIKYLTDGIFEMSEWVEVVAYNPSTQNYFTIEDETLKVIPKEFITAQFSLNSKDSIMNLLDFLDFNLGKLDIKEEPDYSLIEIRDKQIKTSH